MLPQKTVVPPGTTPTGTVEDILSAGERVTGVPRKLWKNRLRYIAMVVSYVAHKHYSTHEIAGALGKSHTTVALWIRTISKTLSKSKTHLNDLVKKVSQEVRSYSDPRIVLAAEVREWRRKFPTVEFPEMKVTDLTSALEDWS